MWFGILKGTIPILLVLGGALAIYLGIEEMKTSASSERSSTFPAKRVELDKLDCGNHVQDGFYKEIDDGTDYKKTRHYRILKPYRRRWTEEHLNEWFEERIRVYQDVKANGLKRPARAFQNFRTRKKSDLFGNIRFLNTMRRYLPLRSQWPIILKKVSVFSQSLNGKQLDHGRSPS
jgi:hypothetical protein